MQPDSTTIPFTVERDATLASCYCLCACLPVDLRGLASNPLDSLELVNAAVDVRRTRRELTADELRRLFIAARASARAYRGLTGENRYMLYLVAAGTGFRANALANLTPAASTCTPQP